MTTTRSLHRSATARAALVGSLTVLALAGFQACSSGDESAQHSFDSKASTGQAARDTQSLSTAYGTDVERTALAADTAAGGAEASEKSAEAAPAREPSVISKATVSLHSENVMKARQDVQRIVDRAQGQVEQSSTEADEEGRTRYARMVLRVPADAFDATLEGLQGVASQVSAETSTEDVTTQVIDTESRLATQRASVQRIRTLLAQATTIKDIAWLESELSSRQSDLDSLTQQQAWLKNQTSMSTITLDITDPTTAGDEDSDNAVVRSLKDGWNAFVDSTSSVVKVVGAVLPFAVLLGLVGWLVRVAVRRRPLRRPAVGGTAPAVTGETRPAPSAESGAQDRPQDRTQDQDA